MIAAVLRIARKDRKYLGSPRTLLTGDGRVGWKIHLIIRTEP